MSILSNYGRPWVKFEVTNAEHRRLFSDFNENRSWKDCPVRFIIDDEQGDLITMIQRRLIQYYTDSEFKSKRKRK